MMAVYRGGKCVHYVVLRWGCVNRAKEAVREENVDLQVDTFAAHDEDEYTVALFIEEFWQFLKFARYFNGVNFPQV